MFEHCANGDGQCFTLGKWWNSYVKVMCSAASTKFLKTVQVVTVNVIHLLGSGGILHAIGTLVVRVRVLICVAGLPTLCFIPLFLAVTAGL